MSQIDPQAFKAFTDQVDAAFRDNDGQGNIPWTKTTAEIADYFLNVLPPIYGDGCFACSEPYTDNHAGRPVYLTFRRVYRNLNEAEARYCTRAEIQGR